MTIPIAIFMGIYMRYLRPGKVGEASVIGFVLLLLAIHYGSIIAADPVWAARFTFDAPTLAIMMAYGFIAAVLPVWFLLAPRDYLSTFLKIGVIGLMAIAIVIVAPDIQMPKQTLNILMELVLYLQEQFSHSYLLLLLVVLLVDSTL